MNTLRRPGGALKLLTLSWRKPISVNVNPSDVSRSALSKMSLCSYSSVTKAHENPDQNSDNKQSEDIDPFGIGDIVKSTDKSSVLVQGFYNETSTPSSPSAAPAASSSAPVPPQSTQAAEDPDRLSRLSLYDTWLKQRVNLDASQRSEVGVAESYRTANFGQVRVDTDNPVHSHAQYQGDNSIPNLTPKPEGFRSSRRGRRTAATEDNESITETIEAGHSVRIRASEFLKQIRSKEKGQSEEDMNAEDANMGPRDKLVIEKIIRPRNPPSIELDSSTLTRETASIMDSMVVPKEYLLPEYNKLTKEDMWSFLKKCVIFQNDFILAINKPSGIPVHSKSRDCRHTVVQFLEKFAELGKCEKIYPLHRIDKETTGALLFAKDPKVASILKEKFAKRQISKVYLGVTKMCPSIPDGTIKIPIGEGLIPGSSKYRRVLRPDLREYGLKPTMKEAVEAITNYKVLHSIREAAFVEIQPVTGTKHQIRVHMGMGLGCPILGDHKYSHRDKLAPQRLHPHVLHRIKLRQSKVREIPLHLHCSKLMFTLPKEFTKDSEEINIHANMPYFMKYTLKRLNLIK